MLLEWKKFAGWKILQYFLDNPSTQSHIRELARLIKLSPRSVQVYCTIYEKDNLLLSEKKANAKMMKLNNELYSVQALKKFYFLAKLNETNIIEKIIKKNPQLLSLVIYGSHASGTYDEKSDIDILVLVNDKLNREPFPILQKILGKQVQLTEMSLAGWTKMKNNLTPFSKSLLKHHVLLWGARL